MKRTKEAQWYLFTDGKNVSVTNGKNVSVTNSSAETSTLRGVVLNISANDAATILGLMLEHKNASEREANEQ